MPKTHFLPGEALTRLNPKDMGLAYTSAQRLELSEELLIESGGEELCLVCIAGEARYQFGEEVGSVEQKDMLYLPAENTLRLEGNEAVFMRFGASCERKTAFARLSFAEIDGDHRHKVYGKTENGTRRDVWNYIDEDFDSSRFLVGICEGRDGGWTAWPPHEHGEKREETYVYFNMGDSFGIQCVYNDPAKPHTVALIQEGHLVSIPEGYHPNCGCPCGGIFYVYCMVSNTKHRLKHIYKFSKTTYAQAFAK